MTTNEPSPPETVEVKPCPFCGNEAGDPHETQRHKNDGWWDIGCSNCEVEITGNWSAAGAIAAWNTRTTAESASCEALARPWFPHNCFAGEPMREGEFRERFPMEEEIERVARAIYCGLDGINYEDNKAHVDYWFGEPDTGGDSGLNDGSTKMEYMRAARAAIAAVSGGVVDEFNGGNDGTV